MSMAARCAECLARLGRLRYQLETAGAISARYGSHDFLGNPNVLTWLLGQTPTSFEDFARREYAAFRASRAEILQDK